MRRRFAERRASRRVLTLALALVAGAQLFSGPATAQVFSPSAPISSAVLTLDQDRIYSETLFGKRLLQEIEEASDTLAQRNRALTETLTAEELELTEKRKQMPAAEFRALADAFDTKVVELRKDQDARITALQRRRDLERRVFTGRILPILSEIVRETGAVALLDDRAVILSADSIDVTDLAIARIDEVLGDGLTSETTGPVVTPAPATDGKTSQSPEQPEPLAPEGTQESPDEG
ncbi:OmpH family outer membrane protein [Tropicimonas sp. TH_r6]|uniref:OmpH family outer membrane protein n=1 Tax=Tropicimonas sp. TH_r6 TaxID=3082085 RepID=UPI002953CC8E|nr:OmpH family outer membrane protein [Tropicimonas sp. TH_r6]MDV7141499.1 OmpH family outer membrane protein [Tropicimonas sp. TH_r6]